MSQTTTNIGRLQIADPDLGYDTLDGGTALHAQLRTNFTAFSNHLAHRYLSTTLANGASTTITHNFGLNLTRLKVQIWESGVLRSDAQVAADYTIAESGGSSTSAITITNSSGGSKTFVALVFGGKLGINEADFDEGASINIGGSISSSEFRTYADGPLILNYDPSGVGNDHQTTVQRGSGQVANAVISLPVTTSTVATLALTETLSNKTLAQPAFTASSVAAGSLAATGAWTLGPTTGAGAGTTTDGIEHKIYGVLNIKPSTGATAGAGGDDIDFDFNMPFVTHATYLIWGHVYDIATPTKAQTQIWLAVEVSSGTFGVVSIGTLTYGTGTSFATTPLFSRSSDVVTVTLSTTHTGTGTVRCSLLRQG
jgi:hypothetical protein